MEQSLFEKYGGFATIHKVVENFYDGVLDKPNYLPGLNPERDNLAGRADARMTFYERETHTL